jgi:hypothetical protein
VRTEERLAYLAGLVDGDGYLKIIRNGRRPSGGYYYNIQVGIQQLWPGKAVRLFAWTFCGKMMKPMKWREGRTIARCEVHTRKAEAAVTKLLPFLLVKRDQALLLLELRRLLAVPRSKHDRPDLDGRRRGADEYAAMDRLRERLLSLHAGSVSTTGPRNETEANAGRLPSGWTRTECLAYLAGIMDSDGNFRIERKNVKGMLARHYRINIRASQVVPSAAIELLAATFGGRVAIAASRSSRYRPLMTWNLQDGRAASAVEALLPFLVVKRGEAELLLELRRLKAQGKQGLTEWVHKNRWQRPIRMRKRCYTSEQVAEFERIRVEVQALHSGGHPRKVREVETA